MNDDLKTKAEQVFGGTIRTSNDTVKFFDREEHESKDRSFLAKTIVVSFLISLGAILLLAPIYNSFVATERQLDIFKLFTTYSGTLGPFVGVIAGYFFKK